MARMIYADDLYEAMNQVGAFEVLKEKRKEQFTTAWGVPIVDAEPVKHGRWIDVEPAPWGQVYETCSECGTRQALDKGKDKFCGVCGAKMDL